MTSNSTVFLSSRDLLQPSASLYNPQWFQSKHWLFQGTELPDRGWATRQAAWGNMGHWKAGVYGSDRLGDGRTAYA